MSKKVFRKVVVFLSMLMLFMSMTASAQEAQEEDFSPCIGVALEVFPATDDYVIYHILPYESAIMAYDYYCIRESLEESGILLSVNTLITREKGKQNCIEHYFVTSDNKPKGEDSVYERLQIIIVDSSDWVEEAKQNYPTEGYTFVEEQVEGRETILIFEKN